MVYSGSGDGAADAAGNAAGNTINAANNTTTNTTTHPQEASVVIDDESDDDMPIVRKVRREAVEEPDDGQLAGEEIGISTEDAFANYAGESAAAVNVRLSPRCDRRRSCTTSSCRARRSPRKDAAFWRGTRRD